MESASSDKLYDIRVWREKILHRENIRLRQENASDYRIVEELTREAFWNHHVPGCNEHYLVHIMRESQSFIKELDIVAAENEKIVGNIMYTKATILCDNGDNYPVISFGPISVLPEFQGQGIGRLLIEHTKQLAKELGCKAILIYGDPSYYSKFGFVGAETYKIGTPDHMYAAPLLALELIEGSLSNCSGRFFEDPIFEIDEEAAKEFDKGFPYKELQNSLPSQERFLQLVKMRTPRL
ncbi:GNAT family N-acetyltransferase [Lacrimispora indolis]|uniref:GNAT family N-acetyltransferase n=1 Tax=Lacrimispora indolis TaxID=69825 RepID=UPI0009FC8840|nr:N-acetyltransferase [Lacrimispora indolis]